MTNQLVPFLMFPFTTVQVIEGALELLLDAEPDIVISDDDITIIIDEDIVIELDEELEVEIDG